MRRTTTALVLCVALLTLPACVELPDEGPMHAGSAPETPSIDTGFPYDPRPPQPGESPTDIVRHFLDAMTANPITTSVAKKFLSSSAADAWDPQAAMYVYQGATTPRGHRNIRLDLVDAYGIDARGAWQGELHGERAELRFRLRKNTDGEWRITHAPDAMIVTDTWFETHYRQVSLYFFDSTGSILVPEPVFVPHGGQLASALIRGLLKGPASGSRRAVRTFIPPDLQVDLSVVVSDQGVAEVALRGGRQTLDPESADLMIAQIAWTLRQDPSIRRVEVTLDGAPVGSGPDPQVDVETGDQYDPNGYGAWTEMVALRNDRMVTVDGAAEVPVTGPFGSGAYDLRALAVGISGKSVAGVTGDGTTVLRTRVEGDDRQVRVAAGGTDFLPPAWDALGRLWLVDRTAGGAQVSVVVDGRRRVIGVPGISGEQVTDFLVSRDGSRLVAVIDGGADDTVVVSRIAADGPRIRAYPARTILAGEGEPLRVSDVGWTSPTELLVVRRLSGHLSEVDALSVDGSPALQTGQSSGELVRADLVRLVSSPVADSPSLAVARDGTVHALTSDPLVEVPKEGLESLTYSG